MTEKQDLETQTDEAIDSPVYDFVHLRVHSEFSMVDGICRINPTIDRVAEMSMPAVALTDHINFCGLIKYYRRAIANGVKPIVGVDLWINDSEDENEVFKIAVLCQNDDGYLNAKQLVSRAYQTNQKLGLPIVEKEWLIDHSEGLIVLSGGKDGDVGRSLIAGHHEIAAKQLGFWNHHFPNRYYLELQRTGRQGEGAYIQSVAGFAQGSGTPVVATNDVCFLEQADFEAHEIRVCINQGRVLDDPRRPKSYTDQQYLKSAKEMSELFSDIPEALQNTVEIAKRCNLSLHLGEYFLPNYPIPDGLTIEEYFCQLSEEGLEERLVEIMDTSAPDFSEKRKEYDERLKVELDVINQMGFPGYFLIVADFIRWGKDNDIPVGPGRGSGAGSLVAYAMKITDLDPLQYDLLFERFLNPERVSMPDFDIDFCMDGRDRVIDYVAEKYGRNSVSQIITFGRLAAKAVIRDVGRVLSQPYGFVDKMSKLIPFDVGMTLSKAWEQEEEIRQRYEEEEDFQAIWDMAIKLEGITRNAGKHAGGVVISPSDLTDFAALYCDEAGEGLVTQFDKDDVESAGLVKFDFLGLRTLTIIDWAVGMINEQLIPAGEPNLNIDTIALDDPKTFELLKSANTTAVFQLESRGMKELIKKLLPSNFEDIIALVALFRPGPLGSGMVDDFINRKHGRQEVAYPHSDYQHEDLKPVLEPTYGIILYQEQVMQIAQVLAEFSLGGADLLRRAMGKKKPEVMEEQRKIFMKGAIARDVDGELAGHIFDLMEKFAGYGFNKSHSAAYALVSFQTAWLKTHYPAAFMAAVMSSDMDNTDKVVTYVDDAKSMGLKIVPPDVNRGLYKFTIDGRQTIIYGIGAIKGVGEGAIQSIVDQRNKDGVYRDLFDFCNRVDLKKVNRRNLEALIRAGALDALGPDRAVMMASLEHAIKSAEQFKRDQLLGQNDLFGSPTESGEGKSPEFALVRPWPEDKVLQGEKETLGLYLTGHPIDRYLPEIKQFCNLRLNSLQPTRRGEYVSVAGLIVGIRVMKTKKGLNWAIVSLDDQSGRVDVMVYSDLYEVNRDILRTDEVIVAKGDISNDDFSGGLKMSAVELSELTQVRERQSKYLQIEADFSESNLLAEEIVESLTPYKGGLCPVRLRCKLDGIGSQIIAGGDWSVKPTDELMYNLKNLKGCRRVAVVY
ncbi:DNA polymerase III subunit alpha [Aliikangiella coralliicola]|uniref:DNA polymerase III subunit alpha n=1 Tax=Aliikangiella coralliicola TaxID=2592383 RepID=A0A545UAZ4_9GAMM|nr:DNA polymerase III subunit alpha [Aliikangiella coralliicola]TQV86627.1 DNA polymerase III subunit alpha [Aliikangiella coralliicola]